MKKEELNRKVSSRIVTLRRKKGLSQSDLARLCSKDRQAIDRLEKGKVNPTIYSLYEIAFAMNISLDEFLKLDDK